MALKQAIQVKDLNEAIQQDLSIVLLCPKTKQTSLSNIFDNSVNNVPISTKNARMTTLSEWEKPPRKDGKKYGHIETADWQDFEKKLRHILDKGDVSKINIEYEGVITNISNTILNKETKQSLTKSLQNDEGGVALFSAPDLKIAFPKFAFDQDHNLCVSLPYLDNEHDDLQRVYLHTPDMKKQTSEDEYHDSFDHVNLS